MDDKGYQEIILRIANEIVLPSHAGNSGNRRDEETTNNFKPLKDQS